MPDDSNSVGFVYLNVFPPRSEGVRQPALLLLTDPGSGAHWKLVGHNCTWWPGAWREGVWQRRTDYHPLSKPLDPATYRSPAADPGPFMRLGKAVFGDPSQTPPPMILGDDDYVQGLYQGNPIFLLRGMHFSAADLQPSPFNWFLRDTAWKYTGEAGLWSIVITGALLNAVKRDLELAIKQAAECMRELGVSTAAILDPEPISAGLLSIYLADLASKRGDYLGCALNLLGVIPLVGELAKAGKALATAAKCEALLQKVSELTQIIKEYTAFGRQVGETRGLVPSVQGSTAVQSEIAAAHDLGAGTAKMDRYTSGNISSILSTDEAAARETQKAAAAAKGNRGIAEVTRDMLSGPDNALTEQTAFRDLFKEYPNGLRGTSLKKLLRWMKKNGFKQVQEATVDRQGGTVRSNIYYRFETNSAGKEVFTGEAIRIDPRGHYYAEFEQGGPNGFRVYDSQALLRGEKRVLALQARTVEGGSRIWESVPRPDTLPTGARPPIMYGEVAHIHIELVKPNKGLRFLGRMGSDAVRAKFDEAGKVIPSPKAGWPEEVTPGDAEMAARLRQMPQAAQDTRLARLPPAQRARVIRLRDNEAWQPGMRLPTEGWDDLLYEAAHIRVKK